MALWRLRSVGNLYRRSEIGEISSLLGVSRTFPIYISKDSRRGSCVPYVCGEHAIHPSFSGFFSRGISSCLYNDSDEMTWTSRSKLRSQVDAEPSNFGCIRQLSTQAKAPAQARKMGSLKIAMVSPGFVYEPYEPREIHFWKRWFTRNGWRTMKEDIRSEMKSAYALHILRKSGYTKNKFYGEAAGLYKKINTVIANGNNKSLRKLVTENMYSALKNEIKQREWSSMYWELLEPVVSIRTRRARMIGVDKDDFNKAFVQLTLEFLSKQKFEAYNSDGAVVAGNKDKEELVKEIWVFEKSMFHTGASWRLCGRIDIK